MTSRKFFMLGSTVSALLLAACSDSAVAPGGNDVVGSAAFARKPSSDPGKPGDNNSCDNNDSGNKTRNSPKDKNQCGGSLLVLQMGDFGGTYGVTPNSRKSIIFGKWGLEEFIPNGAVGVFKLLDQEFTVTDGVATPYGPFSDYPFFFNVVKIDGIRDFVVFNRDILESELCGQTATVTFADLNIRVEYTFPTCS